MGQALYDTFNARYLTYQEVAETFVMITDHFDKLIKNNHTLLMGPRGCGKTTLLKMLTLPALEKWDSINKTNLYETVPFYAIYIPTDIQWKRQLEELEKKFPNHIDFTKSVSSATITINILLSLCETFSYLINKSNQDPNLEARFCKELIQFWKLKGLVIPSIDGIRIALLKIISDLSAKTKKAILTNTPFIDFEEIVFYEFIELVKLACLTFENTFNLKKENRWALCFDELEIAPDWLQYKLLEFLRSSDQKILFKLTTAPIISLYREVKEKFIIQASENNDFNVVRIWTSTQKDRGVWFKFCDQIATKRIKKHFDNVNSLTDILGESELDLGIIECNNLKKSTFSNDKDIYGHQTPTWYVFTHLAKTDPSFKKFLEKKKINPNNPVPKNSSERDEVYRKMRQLAIYRYQFKKENSSRRSRKIVPLYFGTSLLFEICDGNPRLFIGLLDEIIKNAESGIRQCKPISINQQSRIVTEISTKYISVLAAYPGATVIINYHDKNIKDLLDEIGDYIYNKLINDSFTTDPSTSFRVDQDINSKLIELLELALYLGAIVYTEGKESISEKGIIDKKFRLSHILAPYFRILVREYKDIQLSTILSKTPKDPSQFSILE
jgi:GTPase SAR1 family protein